MQPISYIPGLPACTLVLLRSDLVNMLVTCAQYALYHKQHPTLLLLPCLQTGNAASLQVLLGATLPVGLANNMVLVAGKSSMQETSTVLVKSAVMSLTSGT